VKIHRFSARIGTFIFGTQTAGNVRDRQHKVIITFSPLSARCYDMTYLDSAFATVEWNSTAQAVQIAYKDSTTISDITLTGGATLRNELRHSLNTVVDIAKEHSGKAIIGDMSNLTLLTSEDEQWSLQDWFPRLQQAGVRTIAIIPPQTLIGKLSLDVLMRQVHGMKIQRVSSVTEAQYWLKTQRN
jgi:hypothetical protein